MRKCQSEASVIHLTRMKIMISQFIYPAVLTNKILIKNVFSLDAQPHDVTTAVLPKQVGSN